MVLGFLRLNLQAKKALKNILTKCVYLPALEPLLHDAPPSILRHVVGQFSKVYTHNMYAVCLSVVVEKVLPNDAKARRLFVTSGGLKKVCTFCHKLVTLVIALLEYFMC